MRMFKDPCEDPKFGVPYNGPQEVDPQEVDHLEALRKQINELLATAREHSEIKATLIVNCAEGRTLHRLGICYDEKQSVFRNLVSILEKLVNLASPGLFPMGPK